MVKDCHLYEMEKVSVAQETISGMRDQLWARETISGMRDQLWASDLGAYKHYFNLIFQTILQSEYCYYYYFIDEKIVA